MNMNNITSSVHNSTLPAYSLQLLNRMFRVRVTVTVLLLAGVVIGALGNFFVLKYFRKEFRRTRSASLVLVMAIASVDFFTCSVLMPYTAVNMYVTSLPSVVKVAYRLIATCCVYITMLFIYTAAWERYTAVCRAAQSKSSLTRVLVICSTASVFGIILGCLSTFPVNADMLPWAGQTGVLSRYKIGYISVAITLLTVFILYLLMLRKLYATKARLISVAPLKDQQVYPTGVSGTINELKVTRKAMKPPPIHVRVSKNGENSDPQQIDTRATEGYTFVFSIAHSTQSSTCTTTENQVSNEDSTDKQQQSGEKQENLKGHQQHRKRQDVSGYARAPSRSMKQRDRLMLLTLFLISLAYILSWLPAFLAERKIIALFWRSLAFFNNAFNPWIYFVINKRFRAFSLGLFKR